MWLTPTVLSTSIAVAGGVLLFRHRRKRRSLYRQLAADREDVVSANQSRLLLGTSTEREREGFRRDCIVRTAPVLEEADLIALRDECLANMCRIERSFIPTHKKGGTLCYERVHKYAPRCLALFHSPELREWLSSVVGDEVFPTADHDQSSCSVLYYTEPGDHIGWHYDHNFYCGRHFTVLVSLLNRSASGGVSQSRLQRQLRSGEAVDYDTSENSLILFEGARVRHRATPTADGDQRIILSMTFATDPRTSLLREAARRVKDTAFFGIRALWD